MTADPGTAPSSAPTPHGDDEAPARRRRGDRFTRAVLDAALLRLAEVGYERLTIPDVAAAVGANKTSLYRRWATKQALIGDALRLALSHADELPEQDDLRRDLLALAANVATFMRTPTGKALLRVLFSDGDHAELRGLAQEAYAAMAGQGPWRVIARAVARGDLRPEVDPASVLFTIAGALLHRVFIEQAEVDDRFVESLVDLVLAGAQRR